MNKKILVLGATGFTGAPIAQQLQQDGFSLRILVRNIEKARHLFGTEVELVPGNAEDVATLRRALEGVDGVNISVPWQIERNVTHQVINMLKSQARTNVQIVYLSGISVVPENRWYRMIDEKAKTEQLLEQSGLPYTIFKPNWFMDALKLFVRDGRATLFGQQNIDYHFVALADYAQMVSQAFQSKAARNQKIVVNGPQAFRMTDALQQYCDAAHPGVRAATMPVWFGRLLATLTGNPEMKEAVSMMAYFEKVRSLAPAGVTAPLGTPATTLQQWLEQQKG